MSLLPSKTAPTDELIVARLNDTKQGHQHYDQGLKDLQDKEEKCVQKLRANDEDLRGKLMALESQMAELRGEVERLRNDSHISQRSDPSKNSHPLKHEDGQSLRRELHTFQPLTNLEEDFQRMDCSPAMGVSESFASAREEPGESFADSTAKLGQELLPSKRVIEQLNRGLAESQSEQAKQRVEIGLLQERKNTYLDLLKREISQREKLSAAFREIQEKGCLKADDIYTVAVLLERKDGQRSNGMASLSIGSLPKDKDEAMDLAIRNGPSGIVGQRRQGPSPLAVEVERTGSHESTNVATFLGSTATGSSLPSNKRKRNGSEAEDEQDDSVVAHQRRRIDLYGRGVVPPQGARDKNKTSVFSREPPLVPPRDLASNWRTRALGPESFERPISLFTSGGALTSRSESKGVEDKEMLSREVKFGDFPVVRIPTSGPDLGFRKWKQSVLRKDR